MTARTGLFAAALAACMLGCANFSTLQSADVLGKGKSEGGAGATLSQYELVYGNGVDSLRHTARMPALALWYRRGLARRLDLNLYAWIPLGFRAGLKFQLAGAPDRDGFSLSLGAEGGYVYVEREGLVCNIIEWHAPLYLGVDFSRSVSLYIVPRYTGRCSYNDNGAGFAHAFGGAGGLQLGRRVPLYLEGTAGYEGSAGVWFYGGAVGLGIRSR
jgi:hypothetical protein